MKYVILVALLLPLRTALWAQEEIPQDCDCQQIVTASDATCTAPLNCQSDASCTELEFTASCTGRYIVSCTFLNCPAGDCASYNVCVDLTENGRYVAGSNCHHINPCTECNRSTTVCLFAGHTYKLYVCLTSCDMENPCPSPSTCTAYGKVAYCGPNQTSCQ